MLGGGLAIVLLGGLLGLAFVAGGLGTLVYGAIGKSPRRGFIASAVAMSLSSLAILVSLPFWIAVLSRRGTHGEALDLTGSDSPIAVPVLTEGLIFCVAAGTFVRRWRERRKARSAG
jgi:hypothetical protein